jgi:uncharacterized membrane protein YhaH (DUF805 family)
MTDVFVSYAREDLPRVRPLVGLLEAQGWSVFWDRQILPGQQWSSLIEEKLLRAKAVLVVWSHKSVRSEWVKAEAMAAREHGTLVPVRIDDAPIPLPFGLIQTADLATARSDSKEALHLVLTQLSQLVAMPLANVAIPSRITGAPASTAGGPLARLFLDFDGRINRKLYGIGIVAVLGLLLLARAVTSAAIVTLGEAAILATLFLPLATAYPCLALAVKRLHDFDWSGWWTLSLVVLWLIPSMGALFFHFASTQQAGIVETVGIVTSLGGPLSLAVFALLGAIPGTARTNRFGPVPP